MASPVEDRRRRLRSPLVLPEGAEAGLVGAVAVALVFYARDAWLGEPMRTPSALGTLLVALVSGARTQGPVAGAAALYHVFHFLAWAVLGFAGSGLMAHAERTRMRWLPPLLALLAVVPLAVLDVLLRDAALGRLHLWLGGLAGIVAMGAFLAWRHPGAIGGADAQA